MSGIVHSFRLMAALPVVILLTAACSSPPLPIVPPPLTATPVPTAVPAVPPTPPAALAAAPAAAPTPDDTVYAETPVGLLRNEPGSFQGSMARKSSTMGPCRPPGVD